MICAYIRIEHEVGMSAWPIMDRLASEVGKAAAGVHFSIILAEEKMTSIKGLLMIDHPIATAREVFAKFQHGLAEDLFFEPTCVIFAEIWGKPIKHYLFP